jgi:hypothetical protein
LQQAAGWVAEPPQVREPLAVVKQAAALVLRRELALGQQQGWARPELRRELVLGPVRVPEAQPEQAPQALAVV